ncbi:hypothetical protein MMYC01_208297 [Madurella mycetomatis]|uniref:Uncharacterized protein n=1 Tax=Madurella mycetomatis TaxID=100816 RepID=A0A175VY60_9PEZI|nr:hypothetical protein MMYC01_208297 [Madurella mycetomatis]
MPSLPLKVQIGIRDVWAKNDGPLQTTLKDLQDILGHSVVVEPEWHLLAAELDKFYPDKGQLVAVITGCVQAWAKSMAELLEDSAHEAWTETVLEKVPVRMQVFVEVADNAATTWSEQRGGFIISLPKKAIHQPAELFPTFRGGLMACFDAKSSQLLDRTVGAGPGADDWAGVEVDTKTGKAEVVEAPRSAHAPAARAKVEFFPSLASLPRPDLLFLQPPYYLTMYPSSDLIELQGSHSPSLQLIADYFKRWCRVNHNDTTSPPGVQVELDQSAFGLGEMYDRLVLSTENTRYTNRYHVTSPMVAAFIGGVLGYELVSTHGGWNFRRDTEFKAL